MTLGPTSASAFNRSPEDGRQCRFLIFLLALGIALLWLPPLPSSLWLDETSTYWVIRDGFLKTLERGHQYSPSGTLYPAMLCLVKQLAGASELALRLPSTVALLAAVFMLVRLGEKLVDRETGLLAAIILATDPSVVTAAAEARPYGLGLLTVVAAIYCLVQWVRTQKGSQAIGYAAIASASVYLHRLFATMFIVHAFYLWQAHRRGARPRMPSIFGLAGLVALFLAPLAVETWTLAARASQFSWSAAPSVEALSIVIFPPVIILSLVFGWAAALALISGIHLASERFRATPYLLFLAWALIPPGLLYLISILSSAKPLLPRYAIGAVPGLSLFVATCVRALEPSRARRIIAQAILCMSLLANFRQSRHGEDWRSAAAEARKYTLSMATPVLVRSGTIESRDVSWLMNPDTRDYMIAPFTYYRLDANVVPLPFELETKPALQYMEAVLSETLRDAERFILITREFGDEGRTASWLRGRLGPHGFCARSLGKFGFVEAALFERRAEPCEGQGCQGEVRCF